MQRIIMIINQIKGNIKDDMWCQHIVRKYCKTYIFMSPKILASWSFTASKYVFSLFKKWLFYVRYLLAPRNLSIQIFNQSIQVFFVIETDRTGKLSTNIWNIIQFSTTYVCDFTAHICSKYINM